MDLAALITQAADESKRIVSGVDPAHFADPTPCSEFNVQQLTDHITAFAPYSAAAASKTDMRDYGFDAENFKAEYASDADAMAAAWASPGAMEGDVKFGRGEIPAERAAAITLHELVLHGWDLAKATGQVFEVDEGVAAFVKQIVEGGVQAGGREDGVYGPEVSVGDGASIFDQALDVSGRDPHWSA